MPDLDLSDGSIKTNLDDDEPIGYVCHHTHLECVGDACVMWRAEAPEYFTAQFDVDDTEDPALHCLDVRLKQLNVDLIEQELMRRAAELPPPTVAPPPPPLPPPPEPQVPLPVL